jgi:transposase-like protein
VPVLKVSEDLAVELLARGLSVRDIEDAFKDESGRLLLSRTAVSELGERLWEDYQAFAQRDLGEYEIVYLFVDGIAERLRPGQRREPVLATWGFTAEGRKVLLHLMAGSKADGETVTASHGPAPGAHRAGGEERHESMK